MVFLLFGYNTGVTMVFQIFPILIRRWRYLFGALSLMMQNVNAKENEDRCSLLLDIECQFSVLMGVYDFTAPVNCYAGLRNKFAGLMLAYAEGGHTDMIETRKVYPFKLSSVMDYVQKVPVGHEI